MLGTGRWGPSQRGRCQPRLHGQRKHAWLAEPLLAEPGAGLGLAASMCRVILATQPSPEARPVQVARRCERPQAGLCLPDEALSLPRADWGPLTRRTGRGQRRGRLLCSSLVQGLGSGQGPEASPSHVGEGRLVCPH